DVWAGIAQYYCDDAFTGADDHPVVLAAEGTKLRVCDVPDVAGERGQQRLYIRDSDDNIVTRLLEALEQPIVLASVRDGRAVERALVRRFGSRLCRTSTTRVGITVDGTEFGTATQTSQLVDDERQWLETLVALAFEL